jgi:hypothetical protein
MDWEKTEGMLGACEEAAAGKPCRWTHGVLELGKGKET